MPTVDIIVQSDIPQTFRTKQISSMFDVSLNEKLKHEWKFDFPIDDDDWKVGIIVGPSGSGKSMVANKTLKQYIHKPFTWSKSKSIIDCFPDEVETKEIIKTLNSVGFSTPPSWCKSFNVLSNGEQFRVELARAIIENRDSRMFVVDEFTSVVDRRVAKIASTAVSKAVRRSKTKMIAVSCHYDIVSWLEPDWVLDMKNQTFKRRCLRRPEIKLSVTCVGRETWSMFKDHHYLSGNLHKASKTYGCFIDDEMVAFMAILPSIGQFGMKRIHRIVVKPDYQGVGIGMAFMTVIGEHYKENNTRLTITSGHTGIIHGLNRNKYWKCTNYYKTGTTKHCGSTAAGEPGRPGSIIASFEYKGVK